MKEKITFISVLFILAILAAGYAYAVPSCAFGGTVTDINGNNVTGVEVTAYLQETGIPVGKSMNTSAGYGFSVENASDKYLIFRVPDNFVDQNPVYCDGKGNFTLLDLTVTDLDNDGYGQGEDCNDSNLSIHPPELNCSDGLDNDCDNFIDGADQDCWDMDKDGYCALNYEFCPTNPGKLDCNDSNSGVHPNATEICNGIDDNCNNETDENLGSTTCGVGACQVTVQNCVGGVSQSCVPGTPATEKCGNDIDEDCDGADRACSGGGGGGGKCKSEWNCTSWSECDNSIQTRACSLQYPTCDPIEAKPAESQSCEMPVPEEIPAPAPNETVPNQTETLAEENLTGNATSTGGRNLLTGLAIALFGGNANPIVGIIIVLLIAGLGVWLFFFLKRRKKKGKK